MGEKEHKIGSKMHLKSKKSKRKNFHRIERTLENTGFSRVKLAETEGFEPSSLKGHHDFESSGKNRTWRNLTEDKATKENSENSDV